METDKYNGVDAVKWLINLANEVSKAIPDISFKPSNMTTWGVNKDAYPNGVCDCFRIYHAEDLNNHIGSIEVSNYYRKEDKPKYGIMNININDGRCDGCVVGEHHDEIFKIQLTPGQPVCIGM